jgi:hypothetical protein
VIVAKFLDYDYNILNLDISLSTNVYKDAVRCINDDHDVSFDIRLKLRLEGKWDEGLIIPSTRD